MEFNKLDKKEKEIVIQEVIEKLESFIKEDKPVKLPGMDKEVYIIFVERHPEKEGRLIIRACDLQRQVHYDIIVDIIDDKGNIEVVDIFTVEA